ncbi:hypothetical protein ACFPN2_08445 [Steroidobacter flavus]|uniref:Amidohydrolase n=1 Tax=Steroidobacter flavus TaxID=1842136 RepID=A0ABV8SQ57_9GAMM
MAFRSTINLWLASVAVLACAFTARADDTGIIALEHVTIVDVQLGKLLPDQSVIWQRSRILATGPSNSVAVPAKAQRVDGQGRFVMPGLWDMHVHVGTPETAADELTLPMFIANGVTSVRDMSDYIAGPDYRYSARLPPNVGMPKLAPVCASGPV